MAQQERQQPERKFPLGIIDPAEMGRLVVSHPAYTSGLHTTFSGHVRIELELIKARSILAIDRSVDGIGSDPLRTFEAEVTVAVLEDLRFRG